MLRLKVPNTGAMVELSSKFGASPGEAVDLILAAHERGLVCEGLSFHVGSQTTNVENYVQAISLAASVFEEAKERGYTKMNLLDIGGGFPAPYDETVKPFQELAAILNRELDRLFPNDIQIIATTHSPFMLDNPTSSATLRVDGGMSASGWAMQFLSDIIGAPVDRPQVLETTALGAAWLAGQRAGVYPDMAGFAQNWALDRTFEPAMQSATRDAKYAAWKRAVAATMSF